MTTESTGTIAKRVRVTLPGKAADELERRAAALQLPVSRYALYILMDCISEAPLIVQDDQPA